MTTIESGAGRLLFVGTLTWFKGPNLLIEAMAHIVAQQPQSRLDLVGDGPQRSDLEALARRLHIGRQVRFAGRIARAQIARYYRTADVCVIPSLFETFSMVACEAMCFGLPIVAAQRGALPELVIDGETGYLVEPTEPKAIAGAVLRLLRDPDQGRRLARNGYDRVRELFNVSTYLRGLEDAVAHASQRQRRRSG